jgi:CBS-domain-containing membrane protein
VTAGDIAWTEATFAQNCAPDWLQFLSESGRKILPVLDCNGDVTGIATIDALLRAMAGKPIE